MTHCTERNDGRAHTPGLLAVTSRDTPVVTVRICINSVNRLTVEQERT
jgi:hypothetical protein